MRFKGFDLNLLVALDALLSERSVTHAAERICLSQSATSSALARLREYFGDELLVTKGRSMVLTPRAEALIEPVKAALDHIQKEISVPPAFDPETSDRTLRVMVSDYAMHVFVCAAVTHVSQLAPKMRFQFVLPQEEPVAALEKGEIDLLVSIDSMLSTEHPRLELFEDDYVVAGWEGEPPRDCRRLFGLSYAAMDTQSSMA